PFGNVVQQRGFQYWTRPEALRRKPVQQNQRVALIAEGHRLIKCKSRVI
ncbi:MAG: hypothetical protein HY780_12760, partial [Chloroflexi bacterium]|nr:hypothetical protein [Chloroflexota bacterium]